MGLSVMVHAHCGVECNGAGSLGLSVMVQADCGVECNGTCSLWG